MKKLLAVLLALCVIGGVAFAEDAKPALTFGAYGDITATAIDNSSKTGYDVYTEAYFNYAAKNFGFSATAIGSAGTAGVTADTWDMFGALRNYSFYYTINDGMVKILAGRLRETGSVRLTSVIDGNGFSTRIANVATGVAVVAKPVTGLVVSAFVPFAGNAVGTDYAKTNFGVAYLVPDVANIVGGYLLGSKELWVGADVKAVKDLTLKVGYKNASSTNYIYATAGKAIDKLTVNLDADVVLASALGFGVQVQGEYAVSDALSAGAKVKFDNGDSWYKNKGVEVIPYAQFNFGASDIKVSFDYNQGKNTWSLPVEFELNY
jgi:hypothetical protein